MKIVKVDKRIENTTKNSSTVIEKNQTFMHLSISYF